MEKQTVPTEPVTPHRTGDTAPVKSGGTLPARIGLGRRIKVYRGQRVGWSDVLFIFLPGSLLVLAPLGYGIWRAWDAYTRFGPSAAYAWARPWYLLATLGLTPFALIVAYRLSIAWRSVALHENGLRLRLTPLDRRDLTWDRIDGVAAGAYQDRLLSWTLFTWTLTTLYLHGGRPVRLDSRLENISLLTGQIKSRLYPRLLPRFQADLKAGRWVRFNRIAIHRGFLHFSGRQMDWEHVARLEVQSGALVVELDTGERLRLAVAHIPNLELLLQLIELEINR